MFGDYEAQRHWMELTLHTPLYQWYTHTTLNDLQYWGLDYPPLTAFQSWVCGVWMRSVEPASVALTTSRGWESYRSKLAMRFTVIVSDLLFTLPAVHLFVRAFYGREKGGNGARNAWATALILLAPGPILNRPRALPVQQLVVRSDNLRRRRDSTRQTRVRVRAVHAIAVPQADVALPRTRVLRALVRQMSQVRVYFL
jgi:hypothetical protein